MLCPGIGADSRHSSCFAIRNSRAIVLGLQEAFQLAIELINSLYYFTQINTPAVIRG